MVVRDAFDLWDFIGDLIRVRVRVRVNIRGLGFSV